MRKKNPNFTRAVVAKHNFTGNYCNIKHLKMSGLALKFLGHCGRRSLRMTIKNVVRMNSTDEPCGPKQQEPCPPKQQQQEPCGPKAQETCPPKPDPCAGRYEEPCPPKPDPSCPKPVTVCSEPPPCPPMPKGPSMICPPILDRNNPCNYCPPVCIDPDYPDLTRLKKYQCLFQQDEETPVFLKRGNVDVFIYQATVILNIIGFAMAMYHSYKLIVNG